MKEEKMTLSDEERKARTIRRIRIFPVYALFFAAANLVIQSFMIWLLEDTSLHSVPVLGKVCEWIWIVTWLLSLVSFIVVPLIFVVFGIIGLAVALFEKEKSTPDTKAVVFSATYLVAGILVLFIIYNNQQWFF